MGRMRNACLLVARLRTAGLLVAVATLIAAPIGAEVIDFEYPVATNDSGLMIGEEYAYLGAHFAPTDDGATWGGIGADDPGDWQIEGTEGSSFLGFDGEAYAMTLHFDTPVEGFEFDVTRAAGSPPADFDMLILAGFLENLMVGSAGVFFGGVDEWQTLSLTGMVDRVVWFGTGPVGHRFGVDNLRWDGLAPPTQMMTVEIDVRPGSEKNPIRLSSRGVVPVVLYGEPDFAVEDVVIETLAFGPGYAYMAHDDGPHFDYIDGDGLLDMLIHHHVADTGIAPDAFEACLTGETYGGMMFKGCDRVTPVSRR